MRQPVLPFVILSGAIGFVIVLIWIGAIMISSHNFLAEGADTRLAMFLAAPLGMIMVFFQKLNLPRITQLALTIGTLTFFFALIIFPISVRGNGVQQPCIWVIE